MALCYGIDPSLNCMGISAFDSLNGYQESYLFIRNKKFKDKKNCFVLDKYPNTELGRMKRIENYKNIFSNFLTSKRPDFAFIEDYSYASRGKVFHMAEIIGMIKFCLYSIGVPFIMIDPASLKMLVAKGNAGKPDVYNGTAKEYNISFDNFSGDEKYDLCDSYLLGVACHKYYNLNYENGDLLDLTPRELNVLTKPRPKYDNSSILQEAPVIRSN